MLGEAAGLLLGERQPVVDDHVELTRLAGLGRRGVLGRSIDLGRETRGPLVVAVSDGAVDDAHVRHTRTLQARMAVASATPVWHRFWERNDQPPKAGFARREANCGEAAPDPAPTAAGS